MLSSLLFFACVLVNTSLILYFLLPSLAAAMANLGKGMRRCRLYLACPLTELREIALRRRCIRLTSQLMRLLLVSCLIPVAYSPSLLFAFYRSDLSSALVSVEALAGMSIAVFATAHLRRKA